MNVKRWLTGLLAALTLLSLAACGGGDLPQAPGEEIRDTNIDLPTAEDGEDGDDPAGPEEAEESDSKTGAFSVTEDPETGDLTLSGVGSGELNSDLQEAVEPILPEDGAYTTKEDVALYLHLYGRLPENFITKKEAQALGWSGGSLDPYAPGQCLCIGGSRFGNYEGLLPEAEGRTYTECDIDTLGAGSRGAKRIVFSNDGLIYYTEDHYESFELLYGDEGDG